MDQLRGSVESLRHRHDDCLPVRRLRNAVERLELDLAVECPSGCGQRRAGEVVVVPDTPYDPDLWRDADDEGIGGFRHPAGG
ncbi:hypothetical protein ABT324_23740 [Saccharopolyspora sp. NPDC000359]|uniref:hypothetical protein n=1 Tax=Saccharopolyspora sp. NPDC000359 TaxID=3154251 RepID=UPI0033290E03